MTESDLILGKDLQKVKRDVVESRTLKLFLIEEGQEGQAGGTDEEEQVRKCLRSTSIISITCSIETPV